MPRIAEHVYDSTRLPELEPKTKGRDACGDDIRTADQIGRANPSSITTCTARNTRSSSPQHITRALAAAWPPHGFQLFDQRPSLADVVD
jgi:hypothetical protein